MHTNLLVGNPEEKGDMWDFDLQNKTKLPSLWDHPSVGSKMKPLTWDRGYVNVLRRVWEDSIKTELKEMACESVDWIQLAHDRVHWRSLVNTAMELLIP
jgi:hypothetical protein